MKQKQYPPADETHLKEGVADHFAGVAVGSFACLLVLAVAVAIVVVVVVAVAVAIAVAVVVVVVVTSYGLMAV